MSVVVFHWPTALLHSDRSDTRGPKVLELRRQLAQHGAMKIAFACLVMLATSTPLVGQPVSSRDSAALTNAADSATLARTLYRQAREELSRSDSASALRTLSLAAHAWPAQPAYANALLSLAARTNTITRAAEALRIANAMGLALPSTEDSSAMSRLRTPELTSLLAQQHALRVPKNNSRVFRWLNDSTLFPEGLSFDARSNTMYVSSIYHRNIAAVTPRGEHRWLLAQTQPELGAVFGIAVDTVRNVIWASSAANAAMKKLAPSISKPAPPVDSELAALVAIRISDGKLLRRIPVPPSVVNSSPGDIALAPNGDVLMSDSQAGVLWWLRGTADSLIGIRHALLRSPQGIVLSSDGRVAWVADYSHGMLRIELASRKIERVADLPGHSTVGIDGMVQFGQTLIAVQNGFSPSQVLQIVLNANGTRVAQQTVVDRNTFAPSPTGGIVLNDEFIYIANSLWEMLDTSGKLDDQAVLPRPLLLKLPLKTAGPSYR